MAWTALSPRWIAAARNARFSRLVFGSVVGVAEVV
jgi:hypothetical protein